ncbi:MAG: outer membrane beta-barrel protein [Bacteroidales bacterium]|nr:outer membrane beta-barrel protein [Bacteroidales bacterium]
MKKYILCLIVLIFYPWVQCIGENLPENSGKNLTSSFFSVKYAGDGLKNYRAVNPTPASKSESLKYPSSAFFIKLVPSSSAIVNSDITNDDAWESKGAFGINIEVGYYAKFNWLIGYGIGLGYSSFKSDLTLKKDYVEMDEIDIDDDEYVLKITLNNAVEKLSVSYLDIPIFIEIGNVNLDKIGFYGRFGVKLSFPLLASFKPTGIFSYRGYYEQYHVELYDIDEEDLYFPSN